MNKPEKRTRTPTTRVPQGADFSVLALTSDGRLAQKGPSFANAFGKIDVSDTFSPGWVNRRMRFFISGLLSTPAVVAGQAPDAANTVRIDGQEHERQRSQSETTSVPLTK
jgi:hypothetical protein